MFNKNVFIIIINSKYVYTIVYLGNLFKKLDAQIIERPQNLEENSTPRTLKNEGFI